jgi:hypothetical protein
MMMKQVQRLIVVTVLLLIGTVITVTDGADDAAKTDICKTELDAYETCFETNSCQCNVNSQTYNSSQYNLTEPDGHCASILDASCQVITCCPNCTDAINTYFQCGFQAKFSGQQCDSDCKKKQYKVKASNAIVTTTTTTFVSVVTIGSILVFGLVL